ncbi:hypothetical protein [Paludibacter sp.]|uniref:hypothetical protein n=1 Tax=Paludibacter sp. TaxID=1898105 RepID=UPI0013532A42|nr:hypothetical protein [Paludibacter sp.]MTK52908.1 hypothetical protein [Paludibacter sp.]
MNNRLLLIICLLSVTLITGYGLQRDSKVLKPKQQMDSPQKTQEKPQNPHSFTGDTTMVVLLNDTIIPSRIWRKLYEAKAIRIVNIVLPKDALQYYGEIARGGLYICVTTNNQNNAQH